MWQYLIKHMKKGGCSLASKGDQKVSRQIKFKRKHINANKMQSACHCMYMSVHIYNGYTMGKLIIFYLHLYIHAWMHAYTCTCTGISVGRKARKKERTLMYVERRCWHLLLRLSGVLAG